MFEGFETRQIETESVKFNVVIGGTGPALLLLHGYPETHVAWHAVAPLLKDTFSLVIPDLPGYGDSVGRDASENHFNHSKRAMAEDLVNLMTALGHEHFTVAGHDRGGRVAYRLTLDHPEKVTRLVVLDIGPTVDTWESMDMEFAVDGFHWPLLAQPKPIPETLIGPNAEFFLYVLLDRFAGKDASLDPAAVAEYARCFKNPDVLLATCEDYRAGARVDIEHDETDRKDSVRITCPVHVIRGTEYMPSSPLQTWRKWADNVSETAIDCGHLIAEEQPDQCAAAIRQFLQDN